VKVAGPVAAVLDDVARRATVRRAVDLLRHFRHEQDDPDRFYGALAADSVGLVEDLLAGAGQGSLRDVSVLDVGGGPGYFADGFRRRGARYVAVDPDVGELSARGTPEPGSVRGSGIALPVRTSAVDVCFSSNVGEHVATPWAMAEEMLRVTKPDGLVVLSYMLWWGPHGGHETSPWHYLGGHRAAQRYTRTRGHPPKNVYGQSLFPITAAAGLRWAASTPNGELLAAFPRYLPRVAWWVLRVPGLRELLTWNVVLVLRAH
jgi:SAM-dependent methyltransferase